jgi:hypothetical protein
VTRAISSTVIPVAAGRYVRTMEDHITFIAGEPLADLERALDHLKICDLPCGCLGLDGTVPKPLSQTLERALKTIDAEVSRWVDDEGLDYLWVDSVRELLRRLGRAERAAPTLIPPTDDHG